MERKRESHEVRSTTLHARQSIEKQQSHHVTTAVHCGSNRYSYVATYCTHSVHIIRTVSKHSFSGWRRSFSRPRKSPIYGFSVPTTAADRSRLSPVATRQEVCSHGRPWQLSTSCLLLFIQIIHSNSCWNSLTYSVVCQPRQIRHEILQPKLFTSMISIHTLPLSCTGELSLKPTTLHPATAHRRVMTLCAI